MKFVLYLILFYCVSTAAFSMSEIKVAIDGSYKPFYLDGKGIEIDIVDSIFKKLRLRAKYINYPLERLRVAIQRHKVDVSLTAFATKDDGYFYSDDYIYYANVVVCRKSSNIVVDDISALEGKSFGAWRGAHWVLGKKFHKLFVPGKNNYSEMTKLDSLNSMFWLKRLDCIAIDTFIFKWFLANMVKKKSLSEFPYKFYYPFAKRTYYKVRFKNKELRDKFNVELRKAKSNGLIRDIYKKYIPNASEDELKWKL